MQFLYFAININEWGVGRFPLDIIIFTTSLIFIGLPILINRKRIFAEGNALTNRKL